MLPFDRYTNGGRQLLGVPPIGDGTSRHGYGPAVFEQCGTSCVYCGKNLSESYDAWLGISVDHVVPVCAPWCKEHADWIGDVTNQVTCCRACNEFLNGYRVKLPMPSDIAGFFDLRDAVFAEKKDRVLGRHKQERNRYLGWIAGCETKASVDSVWITAELYRIINQLPRHDHATEVGFLPKNGIYFLFERGECIEQDGHATCRIVRVGVNESEDRFRDRMREHFHGSSICQKHIVCAMLNRDDPDDSRLRERRHNRLPGLKEAVRSAMQNSFTYACMRVDDRTERLRLEEGLIASLAQYPLGRPSNTWLGRASVNQAIRDSGLWNDEHTSGKPLALAELQRVRYLTYAWLSELRDRNQRVQATA